ncbi:MAG: nitronate monooxygenase [Ignavibacteria bacterium]|jgi:enoyl-[acyl-carrier protein] reductase II
MNVVNRITKLLNVKHPIIQGGMVWVSGWKLCSAVSNSGGLGLIGAGSMKPELLKEHIQKCKVATQKPFGVNIPLLKGDAEKLIDVSIEENIKIIFSSAGHPGKHIEKLKKHDIKVVHVVSSIKQGLKAQSVGCDAVVGEGVEAGGHNGSDEITIMALIPRLVDSLKVPVIAAGGIADGRGMLAAMCLGAEGVQVGTRFAASLESSANEAYKKKIVDSKENDTTLIFKKLALVRMLKNNFSNKVQEKENSGAQPEILRDLLGNKREMKGIFEGDFNEGMMEAGQGVGLINEIIPAKDIIDKLIKEYNSALEKVQYLKT